MLSGRRLDLLDPSPLDVEIEDIAHGLARVARWNGQTLGEHAYSVAQHSLAVEAILGHLDAKSDPRVLATALLHDAPEYVIGDMISPFKVAMGGDYSAIEARLTMAVHRRFGLAAETPALLQIRIKHADRIAAFHEATRLAGFAESEALRFFGAPPRLPVSLLDDVFTPWPTARAQSRFLERFAALAPAL
jgi:5'-deoxynucleotidase YfbR-like HD superfamily hydrolase